MRALAGREAKAKLTAKSVEPGKYDLVLSPEHLWLTIHESVGHPTELDRVLGYEANYAGTSFATLDKWQSKKFKYGSDRWSTSSPTRPRRDRWARSATTTKASSARTGTSSRTASWSTTRPRATRPTSSAKRNRTAARMRTTGATCSSSACRTSRWRPARRSITPDEMIKDVKKGIYIVGDGSFSIDQQRYNFQFGGQLFYEIKNGKIGQQLEDVAYQSNTQEFWNACVGICDERDWRMGGSFFDGKGQPPQVSIVSHGAATTRFNGINVINTARKIG
jgi:TldD protein